MPRIGLLSDSHGRAAITRQAVALLLEQGAQMLVHLGDVGHETVLDALAVSAPADDPGQTARQLEVRVVFGNTDLDLAGLARYASDLGLTVDHPVGRLTPLELDQGELVFCHGHETRPMRDAIARGVRYLCHGHTHVASDTRQGQTRVINPGALHRARQYTVALLCTETDAVRFHPVPAR